MSSIYINGHKTNAIASKLTKSIKGGITLTKTEYNALETKDDKIIYNIVDIDRPFRVLEQYQGDKRITLYKDNVSDYEFWYEELTFPTNSAGEFEPEQAAIVTTVDINNEETINRDWQLEFYFTPNDNGYGTNEYPIIGSLSSSGSGLIELYTQLSNLQGFWLYGSSLPDSNIGDIKNKDVKITVENHVFRLWADGELIYTKNDYNPGSHTSNVLTIGSYRMGYLFSGKIKYIGFKWLS